jgi:hypothetical protein
MVKYTRKEQIYYEWHVKMREVAEGEPEESQGTTTSESHTLWWAVSEYEAADATTASRRLALSRRNWTKSEITTQRLNTGVSGCRNMVETPSSTRFF